MVHSEGYSGRNHSWQSESLKTFIRKIDAIGPHKKGAPLRGRQLAKLLKLMSPNSFWQIANVKGILP